MSVLIILLALFLLMLVAFNGYSVIVFAPIAALLAVLLTSPSLVPVFFSGIFMEKMVNFIKLYFPVFLLGALFGKLIELSGYAKSITQAVIRLLGPGKAMPAIVLVGAVLTYGGVSLFVVAFALYPFASELFRAANIPKRLIPGTIALGAFTFTMDAFPGSPQIQNIIPTTFFKTDAWAAPWLGLCGGMLVLMLGLWYLESRKRKAARRGEGYGTGHINEPAVISDLQLPPVPLALLPLLLVGVCNKLLALLISNCYGATFNFSVIGLRDIPTIDIPKLTSVWAVEGALIIGILTVLIASFRRIRLQLITGMNSAVAGSLLAALNTASEYGFGAVIAALPGFQVINKGIASTIRDPLLNEAITTTTLAGITGSASGGMSIALAAMHETYLEQAARLQIPSEVLHRVASMASGGMDTLPHNGAVITLLAITGLTHRQSYKDIFVMTIIKTVAVFFVIGLYYGLGMV